MAPSKLTLESLLQESLHWIDEQFAKEGKPVHERPFAATRVIIEHFVVEIEGDTKDDYLSKPWFVGFFDPILKWYERRYGKALLTFPQSVAIGLVHYFKSPITFHTALTITEPGENGTTWVRFPTEVLPTEDPLTWLDAAPPLDAMSEKRRENLRASVRMVADLLRGINNDLNSADLGESAARSLVGTVLKHLDKAATDGASHDPQAVALGVWELQMACEKTMKAFLTQINTEYPETHDLRALHRLANANADHTREAKQFLSAIPSEQRVLAWRYSEIAPPSPAEFLRFYLSTLKLVSLYASRMSRRYVFKNFAVQLKKPPWQ
jgi:hypothetical protein